MLQISKNQPTVSHEEMPGPKRKKYKTSGHTFSGMSAVTLGEYFRPTSSAVAVALNNTHELCSSKWLLCRFTVIGILSSFHFRCSFRRPSNWMIPSYYSHSHWIHLAIRRVQAPGTSSVMFTAWWSKEPQK